MSGLIGSILSSTTALKANQKAVEIAGKNLANVNNETFTRQRVEFGISGGYSESRVTQIRETLLDSKIVREISTTGSLESQNRIYRQLQAILAEQITANVDSPDTLNGAAALDNYGSGLSSAIDSFFNAFESLAATPNDPASRAMVLTAAETMVNQFNSIAKELETLDADVLKAIDVDVRKVNGLLTDIANLNGQIAKDEIVNPGSAMEFRDIRQQKLEELAKYIDFEVQDSSNGQVFVLVRDKTAGSGIQIPLVRNTNVENQVRFNEATNEFYLPNYTVQPMSGSPNETAIDIQGGSLHGLTYVRSTTDPFGDADSVPIGTLARLQDDLDLLARHIATEISAIYDFVDYAASPQVFRLFFDNDDVPDPINLTQVTAANIRLYRGDPTGSFGPGPLFDPVTPGTGSVIPGLSAANLRTSSSGNAGSNDIALAIAELGKESQGSLRNSTFSGFLSEVTTQLGYDLSNNSRMLENQTLLIDQIKQNRSALTGVSIDEEMANILIFQRAFQASSRVIQVLDGLLELVVNRLVR